MLAAQQTLPLQASARQLRQHLWRFGAHSLAEEDLLALLLRAASGQAIRDVLREGLWGLTQLVPELLRRSGLGEANAAILLAAVELGLRLTRLRIPERQPLQRTDRVADYLFLRYQNPDQEVMGALFLDVRNRLIGMDEFYRGTLSRLAVEPRIILKQALLRSASAVVAFHTHPSGDPAPSAEDLVFNRRLADAGELVGVRLVDHLILGHAGRWVSLKRRGTW